MMMPDFDAFRNSIVRRVPDYRKIIVSTLRMPAMIGSKRGDAATYLENVTTSPLVLPSASTQWAIRQAIGMEGTSVQIFELYAYKHEHTQGGVTVDQLPDIVEDDKILHDGITYNVQWADSGHPHSFGKVLLMYVTEDKRA